LFAFIFSLLKFKFASFSLLKALFISHFSSFHLFVFIFFQFHLLLSFQHPHTFRIHPLWSLAWLKCFSSVLNVKFFFMSVVFASYAESAKLFNFSLCIFWCCEESFVTVLKWFETEACDYTGLTLTWGLLFVFCYKLWKKFPFCRQNLKQSYWIKIQFPAYDTFQVATVWK
jgi:hypothetical protein